MPHAVLSSSSHDLSSTDYWLKQLNINLVLRILRLCSSFPSYVFLYPNRYFFYGLRAWILFGRFLPSSQIRILRCRNSSQIGVCSATLGIQKICSVQCSCLALIRRKIYKVSSWYSVHVLVIFRIIYCELCTSVTFQFSVRFVNCIVGSFTSHLQSIRSVLRSESYFGEVSGCFNSLLVENVHWNLAIFGFAV